MRWRLGGESAVHGTGARRIGVDRCDYNDWGERCAEALYERAEAEFSSSELANLILAITAINARNRIAVSSGIVFTKTL